VNKLADKVFKGWNAGIYIRLGAGAWQKIGFAEAVSLEISTGVEPYYGIGSRQPETLVEGNEEITGSMSRAWVNIDYLALLGAGGNALTTFDLVFKAGATTSESAPAPWVYVYNCKFETGTVDVPQDGFLTEDYDFRAMSVHVTPAS